MKGKFVSVAPIKTNRAERDVICLGGAEKLFALAATSGGVCLTGESQSDVALDCFTKLVDGNFRIAFRQTLFNLLLN